jgi:hypothetical protein
VIQFIGRLARLVDRLHFSGLRDPGGRQLMFTRGARRVPLSRGSLASCGETASRGWLELGDSSLPQKESISICKCSLDLLLRLKGMSPGRIHP